MDNPRPSFSPADSGQAQTMHEDMYEVVLFNDDHNVADFVVLCLMRIFRHSREMAVKIMLEAHSRGQATAEVESQAEAVRHKQQLESAGLTAETRKI